MFPGEVKRLEYTSCLRPFVGPTLARLFVDLLRFERRMPLRIVTAQLFLASPFSSLGASGSADDEFAVLEYLTLVVPIV